MPACNDAAVHRARIVIELHFEKCGAHAGHLAGALLRAPGETRRPQRYPAEQAEAEDADRNGDADLAAEQEKCGKDQRAAATQVAYQARSLLRVRLGEGVHGLLQQNENGAAEKKGHGYLSCSSSLTAPALLRSFRSASAFIPPAA